MATEVRILVVEDSEDDANWLMAELRRDGFAAKWKRVETEPEFLAELNNSPEIILCDYSMPEFSGLRALKLLRESNLDIPFILVSGSVGEDTAVEAMKLGATDYLLKDRLARLANAVEHALEQTRLRNERKRTDEELRVTHQELRQLLAHSPAVIYNLQINGQSLIPTVVTDNMERLLGFTAAESTSYDWWFKNLHPDDNERVLTALKHSLTQHGYSIEYRIRHKDGTYRWVEDNSTVIRNETGQAKEVVGVWADITARKQVEETIIKRADELERFHRLSVGRELQMIELKKEINELAALAGRTTPYDVSFLESEGEAPELEESSLQMDRRVSERRMNVKESQLATLNMMEDAVRNREKVELAYDDLKRAVTSREKAEAQLLHAQKMEAIGTLAGGIAHDFNNILGSIIGYTELVGMRVTDDPTSSEYVDAVLLSAQRAAALVRQILTFSRREKQHRTALHLRDIVPEPLKLLRVAIPFAVEFSTSFANDLPAVLGDPTQVHQIIMNLCTNSWHAMKDGPGRIEVRLENFVADVHLCETNNKLRPGSYVRLSVIDTGRGMDKATMERIFEPYFTTKPPGEGTGLGLSVIHGIMESYGGAVTVSSKPGEGTTFHLYFPAYSGEASEKATEPSAISKGHGERVLFVEDEMPIALIGQKTLEDLGYSVECSCNAVEALNILRGTPDRFDLVITDLSMPGKTGTDFARQLLEIRSDLPIILTTGYAEALTIEGVHAMGIRELLLKPYTIQSLGAAVQRALARKQEN